MFSDEILSITVRCHQERFFLSPFTSRNFIRKKRGKKKSKKPKRHGAPPKKTKNPKEALRELRRKLKNGKPIAAVDHQETGYNVVGAWLAKTLSRDRFKGVKIYHFLVMTNHVHYLVWIPKELVSAFMQYLNSQMAKALNRLLGRTCQFWARRYSAIVVLDNEAAMGRSTYGHMNPPTAQIVEAPKDWPGVSNVGALKGHMTETFVFLDRTKWQNNHKPKLLNKYLHELPVTTSRLPGCEKLNDQEYGKVLAKVVRKAMRALNKERRQKNQSVLPLDVLEKTDPFARPVRPKRGTAPLCHTTCQQRRDDYKQRRDATRVLYKEASRQFLAGDRTVTFPEGTVPPPIVYLTRAA